MTTNVEQPNETCAAVDIVDQVGLGQRTAVSFFEAALERARLVAHLNVCLSTDQDGALEQARKIDGLVASGFPLPPLAGLPIVAKDNINSASLPTTAGTPALRNFQPAHNARVLQSILDAGANLIAKTHLHELSFGATCTNYPPFAGPVRNPYDPASIPGGSSGARPSLSPPLSHPSDLELTAADRFVSPRRCLVWLDIDRRSVTGMRKGDIRPMEFSR